MAKPISILRKKAKAGNQGHPLATLAFYGPDNKRASKAVLGIFLQEGDDGIIHRYFEDEKDIRFSVNTQEDILARMREHGVRSLVMPVPLSISGTRGVSPDTRFPVEDILPELSRTSRIERAW